MDRFGTYIILGVLGLIAFLIWYLDVYGSQKPCGFSPAAVGKEWKCRCLGAMDLVPAEDGVRYYCSGLNFSNNKAVEWWTEGEVPVEWDWEE